MIEYELRDMIISSLRYALGRKTYKTEETASYIIKHKGMLDERMIKVMISDLREYFEDRRNGLIRDDECDLRTWQGLYSELRKMERKGEE